MKNTNRKYTDTEIRVNCTLAFPHLFTPRTGDGASGKYECAILVDKSDEQAVQLINDAIEAAKNLFTEQYGKPKGKLKTWVRDGDEERPDDPYYAGKLYFTAKSSRQPQLKVMENDLLVDALDESDIYGGCRGGAVVRFFPYKTPDGAAGISCGINAFVKLEDGNRMGGGGAGANAFDDLV